MQRWRADHGAGPILARGVVHGLVLHGLIATIPGDCSNERARPGLCRNDPSPDREWPTRGACRGSTRRGTRAVAREAVRCHARAAFSTFPCRNYYAETQRASLVIDP